MPSKLILFKQKWASQLNDIKHVLRYLNTYPAILTEIDLTDLISPTELLLHQQNWLKLNDSYTGMEKEFFQPHWVPLNKTSYDLFIDISDSNYPIFDFHFNSIEPYTYMRTNLFDSINQLMLAEDKRTDLQSVVQDVKNSFWGFDY
tara:strand:- start:14540 stop:14977 length:438 start_codon:yes stop_codon:yes gene_type:complete